MALRWLLVMAAALERQAARRSPEARWGVMRENLPQQVEVEVAARGPVNRSARPEAHPDLAAAVETRAVAYPELAAVPAEGAADPGMLSRSSSELLLSLKEELGDCAGDDCSCMFIVDSGETAASLQLLVHKDGAIRREELVPGPDRSQARAGRLAPIVSPDDPSRVAPDFLDLIVCVPDTDAEPEMRTSTFEGQADECGDLCRQSPPCYVPSPVHATLVGGVPTRPRPKRWQTPVSSDLLPKYKPDLDYRGVPVPALQGMARGHFRWRTRQTSACPTGAADLGLPQCVMLEDWLRQLQRGLQLPCGAGVHLLGYSGIREMLKLYGTSRRSAGGKSGAAYELGRDRVRGDAGYATDEEQALGDLAQWLQHDLEQVAAGLDWSGTAFAGRPLVGNRSQALWARTPALFRVAFHTRQQEVDAELTSLRYGASLQAHAGAEAGFIALKLYTLQVATPAGEWFHYHLRADAHGSIMKLESWPQKPHSLFRDAAALKSCTRFFAIEGACWAMSKVMYKERPGTRDFAISATQRVGANCQYPGKEAQPVTVRELKKVLDEVGAQLVPERERPERDALDVQLGAARVATDSSSSDGSTRGPRRVPVPHQTFVDFVVLRAVLEYLSDDATVEFRKIFTPSEAASAPYLFVQSLATGYFIHHDRGGGAGGWRSGAPAVGTSARPSLLGLAAAGLPLALLA